MSKPLAWSWTRLQKFEQCPFAFYANYISKQVEPFQENEAIKYGNQVHTALELYIKDGRELPKNLLHLKQMVDHLKANFETIAEPPYALDMAWHPCRPTDWNRAHIRAKIDVLAEQGPLAHQWDWKSGKPRNSDLAQLQLCSLIILVHKPKLEEIRSRFVYTEHRKFSEECVVTRDDFEDLKDHFCERADRIEQCVQSGKWQKRPSGLCGWCSVLHAECEHRR